MRVVTKNSEANLALNRAKEDLVWPLRELAANLMRVTRGAGKPEAIGRQAVAVVECFEAYFKAVGYYPSSWEISRALDLEPDEDGALFQRTERDYAIAGMMRSGLQMAASKLLGQRTQEAAGQSELFKGLRAIEKIREKNRLSIARATMRERPAKRPKSPGR